jgi:hypothetical protein
MKEFEIQVNNENKKLTLASPSTGDTDEWVRFSLKKTKEIAKLKKDTKAILLEKKEITEATDEKTANELILSECVEKVMDINAEMVLKRCDIILRLAKEKTYVLEDFKTKIAQSDRNAIFAWLDNEMGLAENKKDKDFTKT